MFIFDSFGASQAAYRNLWYIESPLWKEICLFLGKFVISTQVAQKINILTAQYKRTSSEQGVQEKNECVLSEIVTLEGSDTSLSRML